MEKIYAQLIIKGIYTLEMVPEVIRERVAELIK